MQDIFFKIPEGSEELILRECAEKSFKFFIDKHNERCVRERYEISLDECFDLFKSQKPKNMHWVFINRRSRCFWDDSNEPEYWEVGGCTLGLPNGDVFLFINMRFSEGLDIQRKYNLKPLH
jgi:hypothetical protein